MNSYIRGLFILAAATLSAVGCAREERYVKVVSAVQSKTAMVTVDTIMDVADGLIWDEKGIRLHMTKKPVRFRGSAVFVTPVGGLLTCAHVVDVPAGSTVTVTTYNGKKFPAKVLNIDVEHDLALMKIDGIHEYATLTATPLQPGQEVVAVGNPYGLEFTTSHGIVSHIERDIELGYFFTQVDVPINPGNSGGPLFNLDGDLVGINARGIPSADGLAFSISPGVIANYLYQFRGL